jgi:hypothetical protein
MTSNYPPPVQQAIDTACKISPEAGAHVQLLVDSLWGDMERIKQVADTWFDVKEAAKKRVINIILEGDGSKIQSIEKVLNDENWSGAAKDEYIAYLKQLMTKMVELNKGLSSIGEALRGAIRVIDEMHDDLLEICVSFVIAVGGLVAGTLTVNAKVIAAATVALMEFLWKLNSYVNVSRTKFNVIINDMRKIKSEAQGLTVDSTQPMAPFLPGPVTVTRIAPAVPVAEIGNWHNWGAMRSEG